MAKDSLPIAKRAGTKLSTRNLVPLYVTPVDEDVRHLAGHIDPQARVFSTGAPAHKFVFAPLAVVSLTYQIWAEIVDFEPAVKRLEFRDHTTNQVWTCVIENALIHGFQYRARRRPPRREETRYGIPIGCFDVIDADGVLVRARSIAPPGYATEGENNDEA